MFRLKIYICSHLLQKKFVVSLSLNNNNNTSLKTFKGFSFMENSVPNCCGVFAVPLRISIQLLLHIRPNICRWSRDPVGCLPRSLETTSSLVIQVHSSSVPYAWQLGPYFMLLSIEKHALGSGMCQFQVTPRSHMPLI